MTSRLRAAPAKSRERYADLSVQVAILAGLKFDQAQVSKYLPRRIMRESPLYQEIYKRGEAEGRAEGAAESMLHMLSKRWAADPPRQQAIARKLSSVQGYDALSRLLDLVMDAQTLAEFEAALDEVAAPSPQAERPESRILPPAQPRPTRRKGMSL